MEKKGLITLTRGYKRKNVIKVELTEMGEEAYAKSHGLTMIDRIMSRMPQEEKRDLLRYLKTLRDSGIRELNMSREPYQIFPYP